MNKFILLFSGIIAVATIMFAAEPSLSPAPATEHHVIKPGDLKWGDAPPGLPPGGKMAVLNGDPTQPGPFTVRLKGPSGYKVMPHTHPTAERLTVIAGTFKIGMGEKFDEKSMQQMTAGSYVVLPANMAHYAKSGGKDAIVQIDSEGPFQINYVNPSDDPRNAKK
ncbi:MAG TPA: cupin domain-containing protein [Chthoniobacterales bacterium]|nr:cupin domain-containing protein [Chthoniobacterales bacterium]